MPWSGESAPPAHVKSPLPQVANLQKGAWEANETRLRYFVT